MAWVRHGECSRCGDCCKGHPRHSAMPTDPVVVEGVEFCPLYRQLAENLGECTDREHPYYLQGCNVFPQHPTQIADKPRCTYSFEWVEDGS